MANKKKQYTVFEEDELPEEAVVEVHKLTEDSDGNITGYLDELGIEVDMTPLVKDFRRTLYGWNEWASFCYHNKRNAINRKAQESAIEVHSAGSNRGYRPPR